MTETIQNLIESLSHLSILYSQKLLTQDKQIQTSEDSLKLFGLLSLPSKLQLKIFSFLDFIEDVPVLMETCKKVNFLLKSPSFQLLLYRKPIKSQSNLEPTETEDMKYDKQDDRFSDKREAMIELKKTSAVCKFLENKIMNQQKGIEDKAREVESLKNKLRIEKSILSKILTKISKIEGKYEEILEIRRNITGEIESIQNTEDREIENLEIQLALIRSENDELSLHVNILNKDLSIQAKTLKERQNDLSSYMKALAKLQDFYNLMFKSQVSSLLQSFV